MTKKCIFLITTVILIILLPNKIYATTIDTDESIKVATGILDPNSYKPSSPTGVTNTVRRANVIIGAIQTIGIVVSFISLMILGLKYMAGSVSEKAEYKKTMIPYLVGAVMVFAIPQLVQIIYNIVSESFANL